MANRQRGEVTFPINGQVYTLRLTIDATAQLEDVCSTPDREVFFPEILSKVSRGSAKYTRLFLWACLREHHKDITVEQAGRLIDDSGGALGFADKITGVLKSTQPDKEDSAPRPLEAQANPDGIGARSMSKRAKSA